LFKLDPDLSLVRLQSQYQRVTNRQTELLCATWH